MEDSFKVRVDKVFGSLSASNSQNLSSIWSLTDDEIERNEWNRDKDEAEPEAEPNAFCSNIWEKKVKKPDSGFRSELEKDILDLEDDIDDEETNARASSSLSTKEDGYNDEEWEIKSNIGMDCTLDYEEEEDQYDKVAIGKEKEAGDRLYLKDINDYETDADSFNELPNSFNEASRDPRANHIAAKIRLKEDAEAAKKLDSLQVSEDDVPSDMNAQVNTYQDGNLKPILKRGDMDLDSKPRKRVRFDSKCKNNSDSKEDCSEKTEEDKAMVSNEANPLSTDYSSGVPDYVRNPSKYTCYTFDLDDMDDRSNKQAYMDCLNTLKKSKATESQGEDDSTDLPKTIAFIPRRKTGDITMAENYTRSNQYQDDTSKESVHRRGLAIGIASEDAGDGVRAMEEDEPETVTDKIRSKQRSVRQYRMKGKSDME